MTARELGERMGAMVAKNGKAWPPQTVYMMESGERAMVVNEIIAAAHLLGVPVMELFRPPSPSHDNIGGVEVGGIRISSEILTATTGDIDDGVIHAAKALRAIDRVRGEIFQLTQQQYVLLDDAKKSLLGQPLAELPAGDKSFQIAARIMMDDARKWYGDDYSEVQQILDTQSELKEEEGNGE